MPQTPDLMAMLDQYEQEDELYRRLVLPQEERRRLTRWQGGYRWFESTNVVCLEKVRLIKARLTRRTEVAMKDM